MERQFLEFLYETIWLMGEAVKDSGLTPLQPLNTEHIIRQEPWLSQWEADQLWPSSCAVNAILRLNTLLNLDCDKPYALFVQMSAN